MEKLSSVRLSSMTAKTGGLTQNRSEGEEWRVFIQKESTNRENLPSEKAKGTISFLPTESKDIRTLKINPKEVSERFLNILADLGVILNF